VTEELTLPGRVTAIVLNGAGDTAYVSCEGQPAFANGSLVVIDVIARRLTTTIPLQANRAFADSLDEGRGLLSLRDGADAAVIDLTTGVRRRTLFSETGGPFGQTALANGFLYAPSLSDPLVYFAALDEPFVSFLEPTALRMNTRNLEVTVPTPSGDTILIIDTSNASIQKVDTNTNVLGTVHDMASSAAEVVALDEVTALVAGYGSLVVVNLDDPGTAPNVTQIDLVDNVDDIALDAAASRLFVVRTVLRGIFVDPMTGVVPAAFAEIGIIDLTSKTVSHQKLFDDVDPVPFGLFSLAVTPDLSTLLLGRGRTVVFLSSTSPL
jgi:hypothetical protein